MAKKKRSLTDFEEFENTSKDDDQTTPSKQEHPDPDLVSSFQSEKAKRKKVEDTHKRVTFHIELELLQRFENLAAKEGHGFKKYFINRILKNALDEYEGKR
jgi:predicted DNA binding CopG/RHH family protein